MPLRSSVYLLQLFLSVLVSELHVDDLPLQATQQLPLWALSFFSFLQLRQQSGQLNTEQSFYVQMIRENTTSHSFIL